MRDDNLLCHSTVMVYGMFFFNRRSLVVYCLQETLVQQL
jgi:hypothetical protein